jgi:Trk-type K+ transport system membrane component
MHEGASVAVFSPYGITVLSFLMLIGRLEIFAVLLLLYPSFWKKG